MRTCIENAFWPKRFDDPTALDGIRIEWPDRMRRNSVMLEDFSGRLRSLVLTEAGAGSVELPSLKRTGSAASVPSIREIYQSASSPEGGIADNDRFAIDKPSMLIRYLFDLYEVVMSKRGISTLVVIFDHIGMTPEIKRILRTKQDYRDVVWPRSPAHRDSIFTGDHPFRNNIHEYIYCGESKRLLWDYLGTSLVDDFHKTSMPVCTELIVWSGIYRGSSMMLPYKITKAIDGTITGPEPMLPTVDIPFFPCAEADVTILYLAKAFAGKRNIIVASRDNDFIPALLSVYSQAMMECHSKAVPVNDPKNFGMYIMRKVKARAKIDRTSIPEEVLRAYFERIGKVQPSGNTARSSSVAVDTPHPSPPAAAAAVAAPIAMPRVAEAPEKDDDMGRDVTPAEAEDDNALDWLETSIRANASKKRSHVEDNKASMPETKRAAPEPDKSQLSDAVPDFIEISEKVHEVIDIGYLYKVLWRGFYDAHGQCKRCDPIDVFATIVFMSGSDYYPNLYGVSWTTLMQTYLDPQNAAKIGCLCPSIHTSVPHQKSAKPRNLREHSEHLNELARHPKRCYQLDYAAFTRFVALAYSRNVNPKDLKGINNSDLNAVRAFLRQRYEVNQAKAKPKATPPRLKKDGTPYAARKPFIPPDRIEAYAARIAFVMNYYTSTHQQHWPWWNHWGPTLGTETDPRTGESLYGYAVNKNDEKGYSLAEDTPGVRVQLKSVY